MSVPLSGVEHFDLQTSALGLFLRLLGATIGVALVIPAPWIVFLFHGGLSASFVWMASPVSHSAPLQPTLHRLRLVSGGVLPVARKTLAEGGQRIAIRRQRSPDALENTRLRPVLHSRGNDPVVRIAGWPQQPERSNGFSKAVGSINRWRMFVALNRASLHNHSAASIPNRNYSDCPSNSARSCRGTIAPWGGSSASP